MNIIIMLISIIPIALILSIIYTKDKIEKEPIKLLLLLLIGGIISLFLTKFLATQYQKYIPFLIEENPNLEPYKIFLISFGEIGLIEELSKWLILYIIAWRNKEFNYIYDAIIYSVFVSLGFAFVENFFYLWNSNFETLIARSVFTIPAHASFGIIMGYYFGYAKYHSKMNFHYNSVKNLYISLFICIIYHGLYDYFLAFDNKYSTLVFLIFTIFLYINALLKIKKIEKVEVTWD